MEGPLIRLSLMAEKDSAKQKMMAAATYKVFDKQIRAYGNVGIITGRARAYMNGTYVVEFFVHSCFREAERKVDVYPVAGNDFEGLSTASADAEERELTSLWSIGNHTSWLRTRAKMASTLARWRL